MEDEELLWDESIDEYIESRRHAESLPWKVTIKINIESHPFDDLYEDNWCCAYESFFDDYEDIVEAINGLCSDIEADFDIDFEACATAIDESKEN